MIRNMIVCVVLFLLSNSSVFAEVTSVTYSFSNGDGTYYNKVFTYNVLTTAGGEAWQLLTADLTSTEKSGLNAVTDPILGQTNRIAEPSAAYNCFAYMLEITDHWVEDPSGFLALVAVTPSANNHATMVTFQGNDESDPEHGARLHHELGMCIDFYDVKGKMGIHGVYHTSTQSQEDYYHTDDRFSYAPKPQAE